MAHCGVKMPEEKEQALAETLAFLRDGMGATVPVTPLDDVVTPVDDKEVLFRKVFRGDSCYVPKNASDCGHGQLGKGVSISSQAFADKKAEPSVDREILCPADPRESWTQGGEDHGVLWLLTGRVREIDVYRQDPKGRAIVQRYEVEVHHRPIRNDPTQRNNPAHSVVCTSPDCVAKASAKKRLLEGLAQIASWKILPKDLRSALLPDDESSG
jgi:hypothetical protein